MALQKGNITVPEQEIHITSSLMKWIHLFVYVNTMHAICIRYIVIFYVASVSLATYTDAISYIAVLKYMIAPIWHRNVALAFHVRVMWFLFCIYKASGWCVSCTGMWLSYDTTIIWYKLALRNGNLNFPVQGIETTVILIWYRKVMFSSYVEPDCCNGSIFFILHTIYYLLE